MKDSLEKKLFKKYSRLFQDKDKSMLETCLCWGIECGDGWYELLDSLCHCIEEHFWNEEMRKTKKYDLEFADFCQNVNLEYTKAVQVKEKFGGLCFYTSSCNDYLDGAIRLAEALSYKICEQCGKPGKPNKQGWISTLCKECRNPTKVRKKTKKGE